MSDKIRDRQERKAEEAREAMSAKQGDEMKNQMSAATYEQRLDAITDEFCAKADAINAKLAAFKAACDAEIEAARAEREEAKAALRAQKGA